MCGIAGFWGGGDKKTLLSMLLSTAHRGPDDQGVFIHNNVALGNNRLAIIDLSKKGKQPLFDNSRSLCIVFNGEIYNFQNLRKKLETKYHFRTKTDTEVLLFAYKEWGVNCLKKLNGMFSFVIYDRQKKLLFGARDRLGEKPFKYYFDGKKFAFASEIKGLLPFVKKREIDYIAINHYLTLSYIPAPYTGFKNIFKLPPGHYFIFKKGKLNIKKYWDISFKPKKFLTEDQWENIILTKLKTSIKSRLIADVPLGVFLSGGVDSSALVALMSQIKKKIKTFTISFEDPKFDEERYANLIAKKYNTDHKTFKVTHKMMTGVFTRISSYYDEPIADNSIIPTIILCKLTSRHVKVVLTGDGGDENFAGYDRYNILMFTNLYKRVPQQLRNVLLIGIKIANFFVKSKFTNRAVIFAKTFDLSFYKKYIYYSSFFDNETKLKLYTKEFRHIIQKYNTFDIFKDLFDPKVSILDNALRFDIKNYLPEDLLFKTDIASMASSMEVRAPFLDHKFLELTAQMPPELKIKFFNKKYIFKKIMKDQHLIPESIVQRGKKGFIAPIDKWLKEDFKELTIKTLSSKKFKETNIFDEAQIAEYLQKFFKGEVSANNIFALIVLALWVNKYF